MLQKNSVPSNSSVLSENGSDPILLERVLTRRSLSPMRLVEPGPTQKEIELMVSAALTAPDLGAVRPWRFISIDQAARDEITKIVSEAKARRGSNGRGSAVESERGHGARAPVQIAIIACLDPEHVDVPILQQYISVGAALQNMLLSADILGYGAMILSGDEMRDPDVIKALNVRWNEKLVALVCLGTCPRPAKPKRRLKVADHLTVWCGSNE
ncbi:putative NAD(P)H nitroreductase YdjA [bacterium MnTg02]|nr:putative NAD(P)H nitroreductase YdjA [bacterium MnTg02]